VASRIFELDIQPSPIAVSPRGLCEADNTPLPALVKRLITTTSSTNGPHQSAQRPSRPMNPDQRKDRPDVDVSAHPEALALLRRLVAACAFVTDYSDDTDDCVVCDHPVRPHTIRSCDDDCEGRKLRDVLETLPPWAKEAHDVSAARGSR
jgi:hypothetical protein